MPLYLYHCEKCGRQDEVLQNLSALSPLCCGEVMLRLPSIPAKVQIIEKGGVKIHSKGYKEGYSKEYLRRVEESKTRKLAPARRV